MGAGNRDRAQRERAIRRLAAAQHGVIHRQQALGAGMSTSAIHRRIRSGAWVHLYPRVYGVAGASETFERRAVAACLAVGRGAAVSHTSAGRMWGICGSDRLMDVTACGAGMRAPAGVRLHRTTQIGRGEVGKLRGVPVTSPERTVIDLAAVLPQRDVETVLRHAVVTGCVDLVKLRDKATANAGRGRRGPSVLRALLPLEGGRPHVASALEAQVEEVLREATLPRHFREYPVYVEGRVFYLDFAFPEVQVGIEADGRRWHTDARAFEQDRAKHNALTGMGWRIVRVTSAELARDPQGFRARVCDLVDGSAGKRHFAQRGGDSAVRG